MPAFKTKTSLLAALLCALVLPACAEPGDAGAARTFTEKDSGQTVELPCGTLFNVQLSGNPTTGYNWTLAPLTGKTLEKIGDLGYTADSKLIGSGGNFLARFKAAAPGKTTIKMAYARSWEKGVKPAREFSLEVKVSGKKVDKDAFKTGDGAGK